MMADIEGSHDAAEWKPQRQEYLVMFTMAISSLVVALDATILVPVLPVHYFISAPGSHC